MLPTLPPGSRVLILDSSAVLKSCFEGYKNPRSSTYKGRNLDVAALYGYLYRTMKLYESFEFEALVHIIDPPGGSHYRYSIYPDYKAGRKDDDPLLAAQKALLPQMLEAFGERQIRARGIESDDAIGTLAERCAAAGYIVMVVSPDKDLMQLVADGRISVARYIDNPNGMGKTYDIYEEADVEKRMGVRPSQVADFLALVGDTADNIPGVHKVGEKTAAKWLSEYGDLNTLMTQADKITGKIGENLRAALSDLPLYQKLTNVIRDLPNIGIPNTPEVSDEIHVLFRELLLLPSSFPRQFSTDIRAADAVRGTGGVSQSHPTVQDKPQAPKDTLDLPLHDPLAGHSGTPSREPDPFEGMEGMESFGAAASATDTPSEVAAPVVPASSESSSEGVVAPRNSGRPPRW